METIDQEPTSRTALRSRLLGLDLLRAVAVFLVLGRHFQFDESSKSSAAHIFKVLKTGGWVGVDLFFVLSGYLVSGLLFLEFKQTRRLRISRFLCRRALKLYPAFWFFIIATLVNQIMIKGKSVPVTKILGELFFLQNYLDRLCSHTWSLAVEEHFYILLALVFAFFTATQKRKEKSPFRNIPPLVLMVGIICQALRIHSGYFSVESGEGLLLPTHLRIDSLLFGVFLSYLVHIRGWHCPVRAPALISTGIMLLTPAFLYPIETHQWIPVFGVVIFYFASGCLVLAALRLETSKNTWLCKIGSVGKSSYSIYLWHMAAQEISLRFIADTSLFTSFLVYGTFACSVGVVTNKLVEAPILILRDRLIPMSGITSQCK